MGDGPGAKSGGAASGGSENNEGGASSGGSGNGGNPPVPPVTPRPKVSCFPDEGTPAGADLSLEVTPSRISGVAPLYVFFDSQGTTSTATENPFHDLSYCWSFDDEDAGNFKTNGLSKNQALGPQAAHVFETPGTYNVSLIVRDSDDKEAVRSVEITVEDPETVFAGNNTVCLSESGNFDGCPDGATQVTDDDVVALNSHVAEGRRLLLRRGDSFVATESVEIDVPGPGIIGAYGDGDPPLIAPSGPTQTFALGNGNASERRFEDWRIMDLAFDGGGDGSIASGHNVYQFLALRLKAANLSGYVGVANQGGDEVAIQDCEFTDLLGGDEPEKDGGGNNMAYITAHRLALLGNYYNNSTEGEHVVRIRFTKGAILSSNDLGRANGPRLLLKLHSLDWETEGQEYTENVLISDNVFRGTDEQGWMVTLGPASNDEQRLRNFIVERNEFIRSHTNIKVPLLVQGENFTIRDNIFRTTVSGEYTAMHFETLASDNYAKNVRVLHNTAAAGPNPNDVVRLLAFRNANGSTTTLGEEVWVFNNIVYGNGNAVLRNQVSEAEVPNLQEGSNELTQSNPFENSSLEGWEHFELADGASGIGSADKAYTSRWDFTQQTRDSNPDLGAMER